MISRAQPDDILVGGDDWKPGGGGLGWAQESSSGDPHRRHRRHNDYGDGDDDDDDDLDLWKKYDMIWKWYERADDDNDASLTKGRLDIWIFSDDEAWPVLFP